MKGDDVKSSFHSSLFSFSQNFLVLASDYIVMQMKKVNREKTISRTRMRSLTALLLVVLELKLTIQTKANRKLSERCQKLINSLSSGNSRVIFPKTWSAQL